MNEEQLKKLAIVMALIFVAVLSVTIIMGKTVDPQSYEKQNEQIEERINTVTLLTGGAVSASAAVSFLPDDSCTPIADELAGFPKYFLLVLCALYLEKYMLSLVGYLSFGAIIPLACLICILAVLSGKKNWRMFALKLAVVAVTLYLAVPLSLKASEIIYSNYEITMTDTASLGDILKEASESEGGIIGFFTNIGETSATVMDYLSDVVGNFVEALAVMIVTSCLIPILVLIALFSLVKLLFGINTKK